MYLMLELTFFSVEPRDAHLYIYFAFWNETCINKVSQTYFYKNFLESFHSFGRGQLN